MAKKKTANLTLKLTEGEQDLLSHLQNGYQLETDSLGGNPVVAAGRNFTAVARLPRAPTFGGEGTPLNSTRSLTHCPCFFCSR